MKAKMCLYNNRLGVGRAASGSVMALRLSGRPCERRNIRLDYALLPLQEMADQIDPCHPWGGQKTHCNSASLG